MEGNGGDVQEGMQKTKKTADQNDIQTGHTSVSAWASLPYPIEPFIFHCVQTSGFTVSSDPLDSCCLVIENAAVDDTDCWTVVLLGLELWNAVV